MTLSLRTSLVLELRYALAAIQVLTRIPVPPLPGYEPQWLGRAAAYFPLAGLLVGTIAAGVLALSATIWPTPIPAIMAVMAGIAATGAFHEDGLADTADGLGAAGDRKRRLEVMKDSRLGTYGAVALVGSLLTRAAALSVLPPHGAMLALLAAHMSARCVPVLAAAALPYAAGTAPSRIGALEGITPLRCLFALLVGAAPFLTIPFANGLLALLLGSLAAAAVLWWAKRVLGGVTGDVLGACEQMFEMAVLLGIAARLPA